MNYNYNVFSWNYSLEEEEKEGVSKKYLPIIEKMNEKCDKLEIGRGVTARTGLIWEDGTWDFNEITSCFSSLDVGEKKKHVPLKYVIAFCMNPHCSKELGFKFINWLVSDSPYKEVFVEKDPNKIWKKCFVLDPNLPSNLMVSGAIPTRYLSENRNWGGIRVWGELVNLGYNPNYAFVFSHLFTCETEEIYPVYCAYQNNTHHIISFNTVDFKTANNFVNNNRKYLYDIYNKSLKYFHLQPHITNLWREPVTEYPIKTMGKICETLRPRIINKHMNLNIFDIADRKTKKVIKLDTPEALKNVFEQFIELVDNSKELKRAA